MTKETLEFEHVMEQEQTSIRREKFDLSSTRVVIDRLLRENLISSNDTVAQLRMVIEDEFKKVEDV